jgi:hypothetical protein
MKGRSDFSKERNLLRDAIFCDCEFFLAKVGYVQAVGMGSNYGNSYQIGVGLQSFDVLAHA